jgi:NAD(P)-dependent dehydrogenase (short-subunit alcohol dehydrogenase family)
MNNTKTLERITTEFGFHSTAADVIKSSDLSGKVAVVTGGASGIGTETARALAQVGAKIVLAVRNTQAGDDAASEIKKGIPKAEIQVEPLDLADLASVKSFVSRWGNSPLHLLVNNAGVMAIPEITRTPEGREMQFATNFLGHFALTIGLHGALKAAQGARVVSLSSTANLYGPVIFDDFDFNFLRYDPFLAYAQSKTACILLAVEATRRWAVDGIFANALNPGAIATKLQRHTGGLKSPPELHKTIGQGAATSVLVATSPLLEGIGGRYFEDCNEAQVVDKRPPGFSGGVARYAVDPENARRLWDIALQLIAEI